MACAVGVCAPQHQMACTTDAWSACGLCCSTLSPLPPVAFLLAVVGNYQIHHKLSEECMERVPSVRVCENEGHFSQLSKANIFNFDEIHFQFTSLNSVLKHSAQLANILLCIFF